MGGGLLARQLRPGPAQRDSVDAWRGLQPPCGSWRQLGPQSARPAFRGTRIGPRRRSLPRLSCGKDAGCAGQLDGGSSAVNRIPLIRPTRGTPARRDSGPRAQDLDQGRLGDHLAPPRSTEPRPPAPRGPASTIRCPSARRDLSARGRRAVRPPKRHRVVQPASRGAVPFCAISASAVQLTSYNTDMADQVRPRLHTRHKCRSSWACPRKRYTAGMTRFDDYRPPIWER